VATVARAAYATLDPPAQALVRRVALFGRFDVGLLEATLGSGWAGVPFERLVEEAVFFRPAEPSGWFAIHQESVRGFLLRQLRAELGQRGVDELRRRAAAALLARPDADPADAMDLLQEGGDWKRLATLLEERGAEVSERDPGRLEGYLRTVPRRLFAERPALVRLLAESCAAQGKFEQAIAAYREANASDRARRTPAGDSAHQRLLAELHERAGDQAESLVCLRRAMELERDVGIPADCDGVPTGSLTEVPADEGRRRLDEGREPLGWGRAYGRAVVDRIRERDIPARPAIALGVLALTALAWIVSPPAGLSAEAFRILATVGALVALGFLEILPSHLLGLLLVAAWVVSGTLPAEVATAGFAGSTWFLLLASMAIGAAVARSGLLYRGAIELVRRLPASHRVRCLTLGGLGALVSPGMPDPAGRVMLATPLAQDVADTLSYPERSGGSAGLALSTFVGFGMMGPLFMTGSTGGLIAYGLLPPEARAQIDWGRWFVAALPTMLLLFALTMGFLVLRYRPDGPDDLPEETLALQKRVLGPLSRDEWSALGVLVALLLGFSTQSLHGVAPAWLAVAAVALLYLLGALDEAALREGVNLGFLVYVGVILGFGSVFAHVGLDAWLAASLTGPAGAIGGNPIAFVVGIAVMAALLGLALRPNPIALLLGVALLPAAAAAGVQPWVVMFTVMVANNLWLYPQQNLLYQAAYDATGERSYDHAQARPLAFAYAAFVLVALLASIPYWRVLGLIR
ncbi:MAG TPA: SLC13 family permease, partial [Thermomicrobiales bacterium]|nr:SLC13 family permease [Thermomicrobiales bacterium]